MSENNETQEVKDKNSSEDKHNGQHQNAKNSKNNKANKSNNKDDKLIKEQEEKFTEGEELEFVRVRFAGNAKSQPFLLGKRKFVYAQKVIAMSDRGMTVGYINSFPYKLKFTKDMLPIRSISKVATDEDIEKQKSFMQKEKEAEVLCIRLIDKHDLNMNLTHVEFIQFGKKAVFYFTAPERVDFRGLVKDLVGDLKMRIELRQISVRDRAAAIGATGPCGLQTCCSSFLSNYGNVSIKMAKNQNLALIPSKINGVCGQIKCCIKYEDEVYSEKRKLLPRREQLIRVKNGDIGKVIKLHILNEQFEMLTDKGQIRRYAKNQYSYKKSFPPKDWSFPTEFRSIISETSNIIGLEEELDKYNKGFEDEIAAEVVLDDDTTIAQDDVIEREPLDEEESSDDNFKEKDNTSKDNRRGNRNNNRNRNRNRNNNRNQRNDAQKRDAKNSEGQNSDNKKKHYKKPYKKKGPKAQGDNQKNKSEPKPKASKE